MRTAVKPPRDDDKRFGFKQQKWKHPERVRDRIQELHALGCTDSEIANLMRIRVSPECVRAILLAMGREIHRKQKTVFSGMCVTCRLPAMTDSPVCKDCFMSVPPHIRERIQRTVKTDTRTVAEKRARYYIENTATESKCSGR